MNNRAAQNEKKNHMMIVSIAIAITWNFHFHWAISFTMMWHVLESVANRHVVLLLENSIWCQSTTGHHYDAGLPYCDVNNISMNYEALLKNVHHSFPESTRLFWVILTMLKPKMFCLQWCKREKCVDSHILEPGTTLFWVILPG